MDALTLARKVADIDGWSGVDTITNVGSLVAVVDGKGGVMGKALLLDLMIKYKVEIDYESNSCEIWPTDHHQCALKGTYYSEFDTDDKLPRAVLECIIQANDLQ